MAFCGKCGNQLSENQSFCPRCGHASQATPSNHMTRTAYDQRYIRAKVPGRGFGITGMVLGILAVAYCLGVLALGIVALTDPFPHSGFQRMAFVPALIYGSLGVMAILFAAAGQKRGYVNGISKSGVIMGTIATLVCGLGVVLLLAAVVV